MSAPASTAVGTCPSCGHARLPGARFCTHCGNTFTPPPAGGLRGLVRRARLGGNRSDLLYVLIAAALAVLLSDLPVVNIVIYPFRLFETLVHEWSHALMAIATGGRVVGLAINPNDLSGETETMGGWLLPIYSAGYVGAAVAGALLLLAPTRFANRTLVGIGIAAGLMPLIAFSFFQTQFPISTWIWTTIFSLAALVVGLRAEPRVARIFQQFIAVELCFKALDDLRYLAWVDLNEPNRFSDAYGAAHYSGLPELFWTILWGVLAVAAIAFSLTRVARRSLV